MKYHIDRLHFPEIYEAHRLRDKECLDRMRAAFGFNSVDERHYKMARGRPSTKTPTQAQNLIAALDFIEAGTKKVFGDQVWHEYVRLSGNFAISYNGQIGAGHPIAEEIGLCPQLAKLKSALKRTGKSLIISESPTGQLSIKGDKLRVLVECIQDQGTMPQIFPDPACVTIDDTFKRAFEVCGKLSSEAGERLVEASLLLEANTCTAIGKGVQTLVQFYHGVDLPPEMVLPKAFTEAVVKQAKPLTGFGFSWLNGNVGSVTFWFEGGAWIKTACYADRWPVNDVYSLVNSPSFPVEVPKDLFDAIEAASDFNDDGHIVFAEGFVMSHVTDALGAQYEVKGLTGGKKFNGKHMKMVAPLAKTIDLTTYPNKAYFFGGEAPNLIRGVVMGLQTHVTAIEPPQDDASHWTPREGVPIGQPDERTEAFAPTDDDQGDDDDDNAQGWG